MLDMLSISVTYLMSKKVTKDVKNLCFNNVVFCDT